MNYCLKNNIFGEKYDTYIKVLYTGLQNKFILPFTKGILYRGSRIKKAELEFIKNSLKKKIPDLPGCIFYSKGFFSSTNEIDVCFWYMLNREKKENEEYVLYEIEEENEIDGKNASNTNVENISKYYSQKEILFFPFSSFEINRIEERIYKNEKYYHIYLSYLGKYKEKIDKTEKIPETEFTKYITKT